MSSQRRSALAAVILFTVAVGIGLWLTRATGQPANSRGRRNPAYGNRVDQQPLVTAQQLDKSATNRDEGRYSRQAVNLADHEVDLAFTTALRDAHAHPPPATPETKELRARIAGREALIKTDEAAVARLTPIKNPTDEQAQELQLAQAELSLHRNELDDARRDLARAGGDTESWVRRQFNQHQAALHAEPSPATPAYVPKPVFEVPRTLYAQLRLWLTLRSKLGQIGDAQQESASAAAALNTRHDALEKRLRSATPQVPMPLVGAARAAADVAAVSGRAEDQKSLTEYDQRIQDLQELAQVYGDWGGVVRSEMTAAVHAALKGVLESLIIIFFVVLGLSGVDHLARRIASDRRRAATTRLLGRFVVQGLGLLFILFIVIGPPSQLSTILALAGAGLTVALKDFIVAFFGWFVLMGKNGIRVGDWVEINGIVGEVIEIGLLRTTLLESGNWAGSGHPTGRHVTFVNGFAIEGHYFNFSTSGQWLWDTMEIIVPADRDPYPVMDALLEFVRKETEITARQAEEEWKHAARTRGLRTVSAQPAVELRPSSSGVTMVVR